MKSMTAFARVQDHGDWGAIIWELKTVNSRYLDINLRIPDHFRDLEMAVRECAKKKLARGKLDVTLRYQPGAVADQPMKLNQTLLNQLGGAIDEVRQKVSTDEAVSAMEVLRWPGVVQETDAGHDELKERMVPLLEKAFDALVEVRAREGASILEFMQSCLEKMSEQITIAETRIPDVLVEQREKVQARFNDMKVELDQQRLEQEMVMMAQRLDIAEELQRLKTHVTEITSIVKKGGVIGRRLDFLMQELNREANTLGSKSADMTTTKVSVELKVLIEQMREQVQNIE